MRIWSYSEASTKVLTDMDLVNDPFVTGAELIALFNEAIDEAEAEILKLHEDYFMVRGSLTLVSGTAAYDMPADCYANKIRKMFYINGSDRYRITRYRRKDGLEQYEDDLANGQNSQRLKYLITNDATLGRQVLFGPTPQVSGTYIFLWYIRNANSIVTGLEDLDIPEFSNFVMEYVKAKIKAKQNGNVMPPDAAAVVDQQRDMMVSTLTQMVEDDDDEIELDLSIYEEHS